MCSYYALRKSEPFEFIWKYDKISHFAAFPNGFHYFRFLIADGGFLADVNWNLDV